MITKFYTDFEPTVSNTAPNEKKNRTGLIVGIAVGVGLVCFFSAFSVYYFLIRRRRAYENQDEGNAKSYLVLIFLNGVCSFLLNSC